MSDWTEERVAEAAKLYREGRSCSQIARALGGGVSRNAVIGALYRRGITRTKTESVRFAALTTGLTNALRVKRPVRQPPKPKAPSRAPLEDALGRVAALATPPTSTPKPLLELKGRDCRWVVSGEGTEALFCCARKTVGSYCAFHAAQAFIPPKPHQTVNGMWRWVGRVA